MAGFWQLGFLIVTIFVHNILCREWPNMTFRNLRAAGWELPIVTGVPSLDFVDNFMFPSKFDSKQIIVGNANGYDDNKGEGCISIFYLRNRIRPVKKIAGNCARRSDSRFAYRDGLGAWAQLKYPDHGVMSKDGKWMYFVDSRSCARRVNMWNNAVTTVIGNGTCGNGTLDMGHRLSSGVVGMVFLDKTGGGRGERAWVFFVNIINHGPSFVNGLYIYSWNGRNRRRLSSREQMSSFHSHSMDAGMLTRSVHDESLVYQKVQYGVTIYNFSNMTVKHQESRDHYLFTGYEVTKLFSLRKHGADSGAVHRITSSTLYMEKGNGHVSQHPHYKELLMITDHDQGALFIANTDTGSVKKYCKSTHGYIITNENFSCIFKRLMSTMWMGGEILAALAVDILSWRIYDITFINQNIQVFDQKCSKCLDAPGGPNCYDSGSGDVHCICVMGYDGPNCDRLISSSNKCNSRGAMQQWWNTNRFTCICNSGWRGDTCTIRDKLVIGYKNQRSLIYGNDFVEKSARIGEGFLMQKLNEPSVLIVGLRGSLDTDGEGAIGYFVFGHLNWHLGFVALAGNLHRSKNYQKFNDGTHTAAHMVAPMHGYQQLGGKFLHFVESRSCARRINLETLQVITWIGEGRCGNGTLTLTHFGTRTAVSGMTMIENKQSYFVFSGEFGIYVYPWEISQQGGHAWVRQVVSPAQFSFYTSIWLPDIPLSGPLTKKRSISQQHVFHSTAYGITFYDFSYMYFNDNGHKPLVQRIASLMPISSYLSPESQIDREATHNYDTNQKPMPGRTPSIDVNPEFSELLLLIDNSRGEIIVFNITSGNKVHICRNRAETCEWAKPRTAMWLTSTEVLVSDDVTYQRFFRLSFRIDANPCRHLPCLYGICSNTDGNYTCICNYKWGGRNCTEPLNIIEPIFPALAAFTDTGSDTGKLISIGTSASESYSALIFILALTSYYLHLSICI